MKIAVMSLVMEEYHANPYYNSQAEGLGKALANRKNDVIVYHWLASEKNARIQEKKDKILIDYVPCHHVGKHAIVPLNLVQKDLEFLVLFTDNSMDFHRVWKWCKKHSIAIAPYIGVLNSNNASRWKRIIADILFNNIKDYCKIPTIAKTPAVRQELQKCGASDVTVIPVGLDEGILNINYSSFSKENIRRKWGYSQDEILLLYIGRMTEEKKPIEMLVILEKLLQQDDRYRLLMVGKGELEPAVEKEIKERNLANYIQWIKQLENDKIWELYHIADCFVNLNDHEIFGMAILEAMYYECLVVAKHGPGPDFIITDQENGYLCGSDEEIIMRIQKKESNKITMVAKQTIEERFLWDSIVWKFINWKEEHYD